MPFCSIDTHLPTYWLNICLLRSVCGCRRGIRWEDQPGKCSRLGSFFSAGQFCWCLEVWRFSTLIRFHIRPLHAPYLLVASFSAPAEPGLFSEQGVPSEEGCLTFGLVEVVFYQPSRPHWAPLKQVQWNVFVQTMFDILSKWKSPVQGRKWSYWVWMISEIFFDVWNTTNTIWLVHYTLHAALRFLY